jgi:hypothetical protein
VNTITGKFISQRGLYAPTYLFLRTWNEPRPLRRPRAVDNTRIEAFLNQPGGKEVKEEMDWVEEFLEKEEQKKRKMQEEDDAEVAMNLNFRLHQESGGLIEW